MTSTIADLFPFTKRRADGQPGIDHAIERADLVLRLRAARTLERALRAELLDAEIKVGFAALALEEFDEKGRAL